MLEKDGEDQLDRSCEERRNIAQSQGGKESHMFNETNKIKRIAYILRRNCLLKHFIEGKIEEGQKWRPVEEEDVSSYLMALKGNEKTLEDERVRTRSHSVKNPLWKRVLTCR